MIHEFLKNFDYEINEKNLVKVSNKYYLVNKIIEKIVSKSKERPKSFGVFLGVNKGKKFNVSLALLDMISKKTDKKIFVNSKSEWLFLCGRDVMGESVIKANVKSGLVLVQDEKDVNLGLGKIVGKQEDNKMFVKNIIDKGDYLRREKR